MNTPIADFVRGYQQAGLARLHMPGHKGRGPLGCEGLDITEIDGADSLYQAKGIIAESEANATALFGSSATFFSTEGASQCIRAMLYLALLQSRPTGQRPLVLAGRNCHQALLFAAALLDCDLAWLWPEETDFALCRCPISPARLAAALAGLDRQPAAVYVTSPDYLGGQLDISGLARVSHDQDLPLLVDNAHGAYLHFLEQPAHPLDLSADACADSAHKTLPVLTGGAYLHIGPGLARGIPDARRALALFGSTSPSYLTLQSLDEANVYLAERCRPELARAIAQVNQAKSCLAEAGWDILAGEPLKLTVDGRSKGYSGYALATALRRQGAEGEYADPDVVSLMFSPGNRERDYARVRQAFLNLPARPARCRPFLPLAQPPQVCSPRQALLSPAVTLPLAQALGRVLAAPGLSCPPAVSVLMCGEEIGPEAVDICRYYGIRRLSVMAEA